MFAAIGVLIIFLGIFSPIIIICLIYYLKKRMEHKQIMTAIEKGTPLSELRPIKKAVAPGPLWIKNLTSGIALLIIAAAIACFRIVFIWQVPAPSIDQTIIYLFIAAVFMAIGIGRVLRGLLQRKAERQNLLNGNNEVVNKSDTASEIQPSPQNNLK
jgi:uncharacterized membrane-anchored protein YitT (DUF2179 family)